MKAQVGVVLAGMSIVFFCIALWDIDSRLTALEQKIEGGAAPASAPLTDTGTAPSTAPPPLRLSALDQSPRAIHDTLAVRLDVDHQHGKNSCEISYDNDKLGIGVWSFAWEFGEWTAERGEVE